LSALVLLALLAGADAGLAVANPGAPTVAASVDRTEARVGDVIKLTITAVAGRETPINLPRALELGPFSELDDQSRKIEERDLGDGKMQRRFLLAIAAYEPGAVTLPGLEVTYLGRGGEVLSTRTEPIAMKITSLLANEAEPVLKENAPPVQVLQRDLLLVYVGAGVGAALFGALAASFVRRRLRARAAIRPAPPLRPPHEIALDKLDRLGVRALAEQADFRPLYFEMSEIIREYLGARFGFDALEMTTEELVDQLRRRGAGPIETTGWLSQCDLVKFAKLPPTVAEARGAFELAIRIVESTRPRPDPQVGHGALVGPPPQEANHA